MKKSLIIITVIASHFGLIKTDPSPIPLIEKDIQNRAALLTGWADILDAEVAALASVGAGGELSATDKITLKTQKAALFRSNANAVSTIISGAKEGRIAQKRASQQQDLDDMRRAGYSDDQIRTDFPHLVYLLS